MRILDSVLSAPKILNVPLLLLANKQDSPESLSVEEIRENYEQWYQGKKDSMRRIYGEHADQLQERFASLDVMGVSALEGLVLACIEFWLRKLTYGFITYRTGVRTAVDWLFIRVQNSRRRYGLHCPTPSLTDQAFFIGKNIHNMLTLYINPEYIYNNI